MRTFWENGGFSSSQEYYVHFHYLLSFQYNTSLILLFHYSPFLFPFMDSVFDSILNTREEGDRKREEPTLEEENNEKRNRVDEESVLLSIISHV